MAFQKVSQPLSLKSVLYNNAVAYQGPKPDNPYSQASFFVCYHKQKWQSALDGLNEVLEKLGEAISFPRPAEPHFDCHSLAVLYTEATQASLLV